MAVIRLPGGTKVRTQSAKRYIVVELADGRRTFRPQIITRTDDIKRARKATVDGWQPYKLAGGGDVRAPKMGERIIIDMTTGEPVR
jgi:hypothetical protein